MTDSTAVAAPDAAHLQTLQAAKRVILLTVFLDILGFGIIIPQLGVYAAQFGATGKAMGVLASTYSTMGFLFTPFWGRLSDRIGRRPVLLYSIFGTALGYIAFAFAQSLPLLFAARVIDGITGANISTAQAYLSDITPPEERAKTYGLFGAIFGIGFSVGPMIGAVLTHLPGVWGGNLGIGLITAALSFLNWFLAVKLLPETLSPEMRATNAERHASQGNGKWQIINTHGFRRAFALPNLNRVMLISFFAVVAFATLQGTFTLFLIRQFVRPAIQQQIKANPDAALALAGHRLKHDPATSAGAALAGGEGGDAVPAPAATVDGDVVPYTPEMGGDFTLDNRPTPEGLSWRRVEQLLVQPRSAQMAGWVFTVIGLTAMFVQGGLVGPLKKRLGEVNMVIFGTLLMAIGLALVPAPQHFAGLFPVMALLAFGNSISTPVLTALVSELTPAPERGEIIGVYQATQSLGRIFGPLIGGTVFELIAPGAPFIAGAIIMLLSFALSFGLRGAHPQTEE